MDVSNYSILNLWGLSTLAGWLVTAAGFKILLAPELILFAWAVLLIPPIALTLDKLIKKESNDIFNAWTLSTTILMTQNFFYPLEPVFSYFSLWSMAVGVLYYFTYTQSIRKENIYLIGSIISILASAGPYVLPLYYVSIIYAVVQSTPIFYQWYKRNQ